MKTAPLPPKTLLAGLISSMMLVNAQLAFADDIRSLPPVEVVSRYSLLGVGDTANEGAAGQFQIDNRVVARTGEVLEVIPGLIVSQHSGEGKANQYFLRGFNLDHGIDFKMSLDGMPINQRSHAHGQGWADLNPLIPELISSIHYRKGPYYASEGDFANAGSANIFYTDTLEKGLASFGLGQNGFARTLIANAPKYNEGNLLYALELSHYDGPWDNPDNYKKYNGIVRYTEGSSAKGFNITAMAYSGKWNSTDQIPWNEYKAGSISRWGSMDPTAGATAHRYSLSTEWRQPVDGGSVLAQAYVINNYLDLYSNFEYSPASQFNQRDSRVTTGFNLARTWDIAGLGKEATNTLGVQVQNDNIHNSLNSTTARVRNSTCQLPDSAVCRSDHIGQSSIGLYAENHVHWNDWLRTVAGLRGDYFRFKNVGLSDSANTATVNDFIASPKLNVVFGPWSKTEYYYSIGNGYHSNDARGVTIGSGTRADGLVKTFGQEVGIRTEIIEGLQTTFAVFQLDNASEIVYIGDEGVTEDSGRRSRRTGFEFNNYLKANKWLTIDADFAYSRARFRDSAASGNYIEGAVEGVASVAAIVDNGGPYSGSLQLRYFGPRPLTEDNSIRSDGTTTVNGKLGYRINKDTKIELIGFNLLNSQHSAIDYYSDSYTFNGVSGQSGRVFHPIESRSFRAMLITRF
jgi:TonB dependent receptor/TonB-dependent Receptor Plug Domain